MLSYADVSTRWRLLTLLRVQGTSDLEGANASPSCMLETGNSVKVGMQPAKDPVLLYIEGPFEQSAIGPVYEVEMKSCFAHAG